MKKRRFYIYLTVVLCGNIAQAQSSYEQLLVNKGILFVSPNEVLSTSFDFTNMENGRVINDGVVYYFGNFNNDGSYTFNKNKMTGKVVFNGVDMRHRVQLISGNSLIEFFDLELNNSTSKVAFDLKNNLDVFGTLDFKKGIVKVDDIINPINQVSYGMLTFHPGSKAVHMSDQSYVEGEVEKIGKDYFQFPIGDKQLYRPSNISAPKDIKDAIVMKYNVDDSTFFKSHQRISNEVKILNSTEYWKIEAKLQGKETVVLSLSWDERITLSELLKDPESNLHIVRWDEKKAMWVDEGGVVDVSNKMVSTLTEVKDFGYFTLAIVKQEEAVSGNIVIYNLVTANGDGKNDYFIIDNIYKYPNNRVEVYNRWGERVYEATGYDPHGDGSINVFKGYSEGKITIDKAKKLPSGTYYYILTYEYKDDNGSHIVKKAANLHLETN